MKGYKDNPRRLSPEQEKLLKKSIKEFGDLSGITHNLNSGEIITGNQRCKALNVSDCKKELVKTMKNPDRFGTVAYGWIETEYGKMFYRQVKWGRKKSDRACIAANKIGGIWDYVKLSESFNISELQGWGFMKEEILYIKNISFDITPIEQKKKPKESKDSPKTRIKVGRFVMWVDSKAVAKWLDDMESKYDYNSRAIKDEIKKAIFG